MGGSIFKYYLNVPFYKRTFTVPGSNGRDYQADYYSLDVILTVGHRVRSRKAMEVPHRPI